MFQIREYSEEYREEATALVMNLEKFYPTIKEWWRKELDKIRTRENDEHCLLVLLDGKVGGIAVSGIETKSVSTVKIKTFYLSPELQHLGIGPFLLETVLNYWVDKEIKKFFVTFAQEEVKELLNYFQTFGFQLECVSPFNYRPHVSEYYMSKLQVYETIGPEDLKTFCSQYLFRLRGYEIVKEDTDSLVVIKLITLKQPRKIFVKFLKDTELSEVDVKKIEQEAVHEGCLSTIIISYYPLDFPIDSHRDVIVIDGYDLETIFYPLKLDREEYTGIIHTVRPEYGKQIFYDGAQTTFQPPHKKILRRDNMFFKSIQGYKKLKRGSVCVLYESEPSKEIIGEAQIKDIYLDTPERLYEKSGRKAVLSLDDIKKDIRSDGEGRVLGIEYGTRRKYKNPIPLKTVKKIIPNFNPQGIHTLTQTELDRLREFGGSP